MDRSTFQKNYNLSRGQVDRLLAKAWPNGGRFELPECGVFRATKIGTGRTAPVDIVPVRTAAAVSGPVSTGEVPGAGGDAEAGGGGASELSGSAAIPPDLARMSKPDLDRLLVAANILKVRQSTESEKKKIREDVLAETVTAVSMAFSGLRRVIEDLRLPPEQLDRLRAALHESLNQLDGVRLNER